MPKIFCPCENTIEMEFPEEIDLEKESFYYSQILDGSFQNTECPRCGNLIKPELKTRLKDKSKDLDLLFLPESLRSDFINGRLDDNVPALVIGFPELVERIHLILDNLDPGAVEILKFFLKKKVGNDDAVVFFAKKQEEHLVFHVMGLKDGEVAMTRIPEKTYQHTLASLENNREEELYAAILSPPYISANKVSILEDEE